LPASEDDPEKSSIFQVMIEIKEIWSPVPQKDQNQSASMDAGRT